MTEGAFVICVTNLVDFDLIKRSSNLQKEILRGPSSQERCQCGIELLILVKSSIDHFDRRNAIRKRWRLIDPGAVMINFLVGKNDQEKGGQKSGLDYTVLYCIASF